MNDSIARLPFVGSGISAIGTPTACVGGHRRMLRLGAASPPVMHRRPGITLVELLVVIAIIGVLVCLLVPATQMARETARRVQCGSNLRQLGLATLQFNELKRRMPAGAYFSSSTKRGTILVRLLPFVDQTPLYSLYDFLANNTDNQVYPSTTTLLASTVIPTFRCPSDSSPSIQPSPPLGDSGPRALCNYAASVGPESSSNNPNCSCSNPFNIYSVAPGWGTGKNNYDNYRPPGNPKPANAVMWPPGAFTRYGVEFPITRVKDGLSKTIFFGEILPWCSSHAGSGWATSNNGQGMTRTTIPINFDSCSGTTGCNAPCNWNTELGFRSRHPGGAHFLFGDGAVRWLDEMIDMWTYQYLGGVEDGNAVAIP